MLWIVKSRTYPDQDAFVLLPARWFLSSSALATLSALATRLSARYSNRSINTAEGFIELSDRFSINYQ